MILETSLMRMLRATKKINYLKATQLMRLEVGDRGLLTPKMAILQAPSQCCSLLSRGDNQVKVRLK